MHATRPLVAAGLASCLLLAVAAPARANGRFPASNQIVFSPSDSASPAIVGRTTFGILPSRDDGATWRWVCEDVLALPPNMALDPELALTAGSGLVVGVPNPYSLGASVSTDLGCNWACATDLASQPVADVVLRPASPHSVLALLPGALTADGGGTPPQIFESKDDGAHWAPLGAPLSRDPTLAVFTIDVARSDASRIYVSATLGYGSQRTAVLFVSTDDGATWTARTVGSFDPQSEGAIYIAAVDPTDADRVYLRSGGAQALTVDATNSSDMAVGGSRLFVTSNAGNAFAIANLPVTWQILGFALSEDGSRVYAGTYGDGLFAASRSDLKFSKTSSIHVECLATRGPELWACSDAASGFIFGVSTDEGACFQPKLQQLTTLAGPIACSPNPGGPLACHATSNASACTNDAFQGLCAGAFAMNDNCFVDAGPILDGGCARQSDAGAAPTVGGGSCGCTTPGRGGMTGLAALAMGCALASAAALRRRRRV